ncbi:uncharacterized protein [Dermacentor albipictus]|uniref:uncharacterized protein n=1 Tax=Dermacentor albipictus TaxID=60249 RepID=UPI0038FC15AA
MTHLFAVVEFPEEDCSLAVVHGSWLNPKRNRTYWPTLKNSSQRRRATVEGAAPSPSWTQANCVVKSWADTYEKACEKQNFLQYHSDMSCEEELGRGKRKKRSALASDYSSEPDTTDDSGDDSNYHPPRPPTPPQLVTNIGGYDSAAAHVSCKMPGRHRKKRSAGASASPRPSFGIAGEPETESVPSSLPAGPSTTSSGSRTDPQVLAFMERILSSLNTIKVVQQAHTQLLAQMNNAEEACPENQNLPDQLPFLTTRDMLDWDAELGVNKEAKLRMKRHMVVQGGDTINQKTARILKSVMSWDVAKQFSWYGAKGKMKFCELNICKLLCSNLPDRKYKHNQEEATLKNIEKAAMSWFRHAAERAAAGQQRQLNKTSAQDNDALIS